MNTVQKYVSSNSVGCGAIMLDNENVQTAKFKTDWRSLEHKKGLGLYGIKASITLTKLL